jgi:hypothetical protein
LTGSLSITAASANCKFSDGCFSANHAQNGTAES